MYNVSDTTRRRLEGVYAPLVDCFEIALTRYSLIDFGVAHLGGVRTAEQQHELYLQESSELDGYNSKSAHQYGYAVDLYIWYNGKTSWKPKHFMSAANAMFAAAQDAGIQLEWGGFWRPYTEENGLRHGWDMGHFEIKDWRNLVNENV